METSRNQSADAALISLEAAAAAARGGFACMFSTSDEFETALITERRAQGRYAPPTQPLAGRHVRRLRADGGRHGAAAELNCIGITGMPGRREAPFSFRGRLG